MPLLTAEIEEIELDYCAEELGVWFDEGEIEALFQSTVPILAVDKGGKKGKRRCPRCNAKMRLHYPLPELELDICANGCGIWFDAGEVNQLAIALEQNQLAQQAQLNQVFDNLNRMLGGKQ